MDFNNKKTHGSWNIENFLTYCTNTVQNLKWQNVLFQFDRQKLIFSS